MKVKLLSLVCVLVASAAAIAQPLRFDDVIRNLRNPDPKARLSAVKLLREARYPEAIAPMAALVTDPVDEIQLETIAAELSFFLGEEVKARRMIGFVVEKRSSTLAAAAFEAGPGVVWPRATPPELVSALLAAMNDENQKVRLEATYALGVVAHAPLAPDQAQILIKGLDHYDPAVRAASAQVIGRLKVTSAGDALLKAVNDSREDVRYAAMHALGAIHHVDAADALGQQFVFYGKGEGAWAALDALAHLGLASNAPLFKEHLADKDPYLRRAAAEGLGRAGDRSAVDTLQAGATTDDSAMVRLAMAFALQKLGQNYVSRIADAMTSQKLRAQAEDYLVEFGPSVTQPLLARLQDPDAGVREATADVLGFVGGDAAIPALQAAAKDKDADVADAAKRAIERIKAKA